MDELASKERAENLSKLVLKFKIFMLSEDMSYSDKVAAITFIAENFFKILHSYKIDDNLYQEAKIELFDAIINMKDEASIDQAFFLLLSYLEMLSKLLRKWL